MTVSPVFEQLTKEEVEVLFWRYRNDRQGKTTIFTANQLFISEEKYYKLQRSAFEKLKLETIEPKKMFDEVIARFSNELELLTEEDIKNWKFPQKIMVQGKEVAEIGEEKEGTEEEVKPEEEKVDGKEVTEMEEGKEETEEEVKPEEEKREEEVRNNKPLNFELPENIKQFIKDYWIYGLMGLIIIILLIIILFPKVSPEAPPPVSSATLSSISTVESPTSTPEVPTATTVGIVVVPTTQAPTEAPILTATSTPSPSETPNPTPTLQPIGLHPKKWTDS